MGNKKIGATLEAVKLGIRMPVWYHPAVPMLGSIYKKITVDLEKGCGASEQSLYCASGDGQENAAVSDI